MPQAVHLENSQRADVFLQSSPCLEALQPMSLQTWAALQKHISPFVVFQMNCLQRICGISLRDHVPNVDILNRCNTFSVSLSCEAKGSGG